MDTLIYSPFEILKIIESSFSPLRCVAELTDYEQKIKIRIFDNKDNPLLSFPEEKVSNLKDKNTLFLFIQEIRTRLDETFGVKIKP